MKNQTLLSIGNDTKTTKGEAKGYRTAILYLAPADLSGRNVCPWATEECKALCLNTAGRGIFDSVQQARLRRTLFFHVDKAGFLDQLDAEIRAFIKSCERDGMVPCIRLNGTSDIRWEKLGIMEQFPSVQFYDYTKGASRFDSPLPSNYRLVLSYTGHNDNSCAAYLSQGGTVSMVFAGKELPPSYRFGNVEFPVIDGDVNDLRFLDPKGVIVGLRAKGAARKAKGSAFVVGS